jgi:putative oxidoreductase
MFVHWFFAIPIRGAGASVGLLLARIAFGGFMLFGHGWGKLVNFTEYSAVFGDPLGLGSALTLVLAVFAEVFCAFLIVIGLFTRAALLPLLATMFVAAFVVHWGDPLFLGQGAAKEPALLYLFAYLSLLFTGPGTFSLDRFLADR